MTARRIVWLVSACFLTASVSFADETLPVLRVGREVYRDVTVTGVSATDIYFSHAGGMGNAKLKNLEPDLQKHFHFDPARADELEKQQDASSAEFRSELAAKKPAADSITNSQPDTSRDEYGELIVNKIFARSVRGQRPPQIFVDQWLTPAPEIAGRFVLVEFWATWAEPCRSAVPHLNDLQAKFKDTLVIIGLSNEPTEEMRKMSAPKVNYFVGTDTQSRTMTSLQVQAIPHAILIDPKGIVRFEGPPTFLDEKSLRHLLETYVN